MATRSQIIEADPGPLDGPLDDGPLQIPTPTILDQIAGAVAAYPATDVRLDIIDVTFPGDALNTNEQGGFVVKVTNNGPLTMKDVLVKVVAKNGAQVKNGSALAVFDSEAISANIIETIAGSGGSDDTDARFVFKAPAGTKSEGTVLLEATVHSWNATWDYTLNRESGASDSPVATFASSVVAL
jgi:hypothetical protein